MRSSIKALVGGTAILLFAIAPLREEPNLIPQQSDGESINTGAAQSATSHAATESKPVTVEIVSAPSLQREAFAAFDDWVARYNAAPVQTAALLEEGETIVRTRRHALAELIETDPEQALRLAVSYEQGKALPPSITRYLEEPISGYGRYDVIGVAPGYGAAEEKQKFIERVVTLDERTFRAAVYGRRLLQGSLDNIPFHGIAIDDSLAVAEHPVRVLGPTEAADRLAGMAKSAAECPISEKPGSVAHAAEVGGEVRFFCHDGHIEALNSRLEEAEAGTMTRQSAYKLNAGWTLGNKTLLFMRVNFTDDPTETITAKTAAALMEKVNAFFQVNSYGKLSLSSTITPLLTLPHEKSWYKTSRPELGFQRVMDDARAVAAAAGFDTRSFDLDCVHINGNVVSPRAYIGQKGATLCDERVAAACHELGHNLGVAHANGWSTTDGSIVGEGYDVEYQNKFDAMGLSTGEPGQYNACHKYRLNWLPESAVQTIDGDGVYRLYAYDVPSLELGRTYALRMKKDGDRDYWIETRVNFATLNVGDLLINWSPWYMSQGGTELLDMTPDGDGGFYDAQLTMGRSFYDPELGVEITPLARPQSTLDAVDILVRHVNDRRTTTGESVTPRLALTVYQGQVLVSLEATSASTWIIQGSSDFEGWNTIGTLRPGQTSIRDETASEERQRFYRALRY